MSGFSIGVKIGINYCYAPNLKIKVEEDVDDVVDAVMLEDFLGCILLEDESYMMLEDDSATQQTTEFKVSKSYWNF